MSKRERESSDINSHRPLKRQRKIEADINCLPVEIAEKILLFIPKQNLQEIACVCSQWASFISSGIFWRLSCIDRWKDDIYPNTLGSEVISVYDLKFIVPLRDLMVDWKSYYLIRDNLANVLAFRECNHESSELTVARFMNVLLEQNLWYSKRTQNRKEGVKDAQQSYAKVITRVSEILLEQDRDPELVSKLLARDNFCLYNASWLCKRLVRICQLVLNRIEKLDSKAFKNSYTWLERCFNFIEEMNQQECEIFAEMIHIWSVWHSVPGNSMNLITFADSKENSMTKQRTMLQLYFEAANKIINEDTEDPKLQLGYLMWSQINDDITKSNTDAIAQLFELNRSTCNSKHEMIRKEALLGLTVIADALDHFNDEQVMFVYEKFFHELKTCPITDMIDTFTHIVDLGIRLSGLLDDNKLDELNQTILARLSEDNSTGEMSSLDVLGEFGTAFGKRLKKYLPEYIELANIKRRQSRSLVSGVEQLGFHAIGEWFAVEAKDFLMQNAFPMKCRCTCHACKDERKKRKNDRQYLYHITQKSKK